MARIGSSCMWALGQWDRDHFEAYMSELPRDTYDGLFFRAVYSIHLNDHESSQGFIRQARDILGALQQLLLVIILLFQVSLLFLLVLRIMIWKSLNYKIHLTLLVRNEQY